ncbi:hypothetical protein V5N11_016519 [Cardamine amara subsp. amara]|uniref:Uncharacterized protein n=1 Tax=Cardamine amara subsp. amara TaxID=228776 RepID=A0ABD1A200_CARAN
MESGSLDKLYYVSKPLDMGRDDFGGYTNQEVEDSDPSIAPTTFDKEFHETTVQRIVKNYTDKIMLVLEDISSRLSRVELCCNNLDKTIGEMRSDLTHEGEEADLKRRSLGKHLQEERRSSLIVKDKLVPADTEKELAKLHLVQKDQSCSSHSQHGEELVPTTVPYMREKTSDS